jgi:predicted RNA methylase
LNAAEIKGKVVLDVGCGTGILSMMAARAGAKHVYAVEMSSMADIAVKVIANNELKKKITVINKKIEDVTLEDLGGWHVDIIVSEWMGYCLFYEAMFDSVIYARDNLLKKHGILIPDRAEFFVAAASNKQPPFTNI